MMWICVTLMRKVCKKQISQKTGQKSMLASLISKILTKRISNLLIEFTLIIFMFNLKKDCLFY